jgi:hypothetical protein
MKDLSDMLEKENIGVSFSSKIINALMYADDVALIAESESDLWKMLNKESYIIFSLDDFLWEHIPFNVNKWSSGRLFFSKGTLAFTEYIFIHIDNGCIVWIFSCQF